MTDPTPTPDTTTTAATSTPAGAVTTTTATTVKPGWKTSEFWLNIAAMLLGALFASGLLVNNTAIQIAGMAATVLGALGYTVVRGGAKKGPTAILLVLLLVPASSTQAGCGNSRDRLANGVGAFVDCMKPATKAAAAELEPAMSKLVRDSLSSDGKADRATLKAIAAPLKSDWSRCALDGAIAAILNPPIQKPGAAASSPLEVDRADVIDTYAEIRADVWGGVEVRSAQ